MRPRPTVLLLILTLTVLAGGSWLWDQRHAPITLAPPPPADRSPSPTASTPTDLSTVYLPISMPLSLIGEALNAEVPRRFGGREDNPVKRTSVIEDRLVWQAERGPIALRAKGGALHLAASGAGEARVVGKVRPIRGTLGRILRRATGGHDAVPFSVRAEALVNLTAMFRPVLLDNWRIAVNAQTVVDVVEAEVPIAGVARVSVRSQVRKALQGRIDRLLKRLRQKLARDNRLQRLAEREWARLHKVERLSDSPASWLVVQPARVLATQFRVTGDAVQAGLGIEAGVHVLVQHEAPELIATPLPGITFTGLQAGRIRIESDAVAPWQQFNALLSDRLLDRGFQPADGTRFTVRDVEVVPWGADLLLRVDFDAKRGRWYTATGRLFLTARPRIDVATQTLHFDGLDYTVETRDALLNAATWLIEPLILDALQEQSAIDLSRYVARAKGRAQQSLTRITDAVPGGVVLDTRVRELALVGIRLTETALQIRVRADADIEAAVTRLVP